MPTPDQPTLFELLGGRPTLERVHKIFYDKLYSHKWLGQFFKNIDQAHIEKQQTDFMTQAMGGGEIYTGSFPIPAHQHLMISDGLFELRHGLLRDSMAQAQIREELVARWLKIDSAFRSGIVKKSIQECKGRFAMDPIVNIPNPEKTLPEQT